MRRRHEKHLFDRLLELWVRLLLLRLVNMRGRVRAYLAAQVLHRKCVQQTRRRRRQRFVVSAGIRSLELHQSVSVACMFECRSQVRSPRGPHHPVTRVQSTSPECQLEAEYQTMRYAACLQQKTSSLVAHHARAHDCWRATVGRARNREC